MSDAGPNLIAHSTIWYNGRAPSDIQLTIEADEVHDSFFVERTKLYDN